MTTKEVADRLVELCRKGDFEATQSELFADDVISIEPYSTPDFEKETKGKKAIKEKGEKWNGMVAAVHAIEVSDALVAANSFAVTMRLHVTMKEKGEMDMTELCVYQVKDGKIISEEFFM
ncbi:MAG TPA: nuclear transport factor 2 family protein [Parafilimonas sp.]|nr:nuclear transport factor 2 family protein [Parafilimonas sp.]